MEGFDKIKNINLADLDSAHTLEDELNGVKKPDVEETSDAEGTLTVADNMDIASEEQGDEEAASTSEEKQESAVNEPKPYVRPEGRYYEIDSDVTGKELRNFLLGHQYHQPLTWIVYVFIVALSIFYVVRGISGVTPFVVVIFLVVYYPASTIMKANSIKKHNPSFSEIFHYKLDENALHLQLGKEAVDVEWKYFKKVMVLKSSVIAYTGKNNGYIIPTRAMGDQKEEIIAFLKEKVSAGK